MAKGFGTHGIIYAILDGWVTFLIGSIIFYHTIRQLRLVHRTVKLVKQFDLFRLDPVYAFSVLTSRTGVAWFLLISLTFLMQQIDYDPVVYLPFLSAGVVLALAAFALPLWVVHQRLVAEKRKLLAEHDQRVKSTLVQLYRSVDENKLGDVAQFNSTITTLNTARSVLEKIPTWPWRAGLFASFLSVVLLPTAIFVFQLVIGHWLGR